MSLPDTRGNIDKKSMNAIPIDLRTLQIESYYSDDFIVLH